MKIIDFFIVAALVGFLFVGYAGYFWVSILGFAGVTYFAGRRFFDKSAETYGGASGELNPDLPKHEPAHSSCFSHSEDDSAE